MRTPVEFDGYPDALATLAPYGPYRAVVSRIVDGDTFYAVIDPGWNEYPYKVIRVKDYNAPELFKGPPEDRARGAASRAALAERMPPGTGIVLLSAPDDQSFGRYVADVILPDGSDLAEGLIRDGFGVRWSRGGVA